MKNSTDRASVALDPDTRKALAAQVDAWEKAEVASFVSRAPERAAEFATIGGFPVKRTYTALDLADTPLDDIGLPGQYPFTRGPYPTMYRGRTWTMRQIAGFGTAEDTNQRFRYLIAQGQTGLSTDFDMPTLMGYDSDHPMSEGEVGREGVAVDTLADVEALYDGIDLENISVSISTGCPARSRPTSSRNIWRRRSIASRSALPCASAATASPTAPRTCGATTRSTFPAITSPKPAPRRCRKRRSPAPPASSTLRRSSRPAWTSTRARRASPSTSSARPTSSRRSRNSA